MILSWNKAVAQLQPINSHQQCSVYHINYPTQYGSQIYIKCLLCRNQAKIDQLLMKRKLMKCNICSYMGWEQELNLTETAASTFLLKQLIGVCSKT